MTATIRLCGCEYCGQVVMCIPGSYAPCLYRVSLTSHRSVFKVLDVDHHLNRLLST